MAAIWADKDDVKKRLGKIDAQGYDNTDIQDSLDSAEEDLKTELVTIFSTDIVAAWSKKDGTVPQTILNLTADKAAGYFFNRIMHQSFEDRETLACSFEKKVERTLEKLRTGEIQIVDQSGDEIAESADRVWSNTSSRTAHTSMTHPNDSDAGDGSMDEF